MGSLRLSVHGRNAGMVGPGSRRLNRHRLRLILSLCDLANLVRVKRQQRLRNQSTPQTAGM